MDDKDAFGAPQVHDKRTTPAGILPKNTQAWVIGALAVVMVIIIAFSGSPRRPETGEKVPVAIPSEPNSARIREYQQRIEEQTKRLEQEQAELAQSARTTDEATARGFLKSDGRALMRSNASAREPSDSRTLDTDQSKRDYASLFASNVALSYRNEAQPAQTSEPSVESLTKLLPLMAALSAIQQGGSSSAISEPKQPAVPAEPKIARESEEKAAPVAEYRLFEGTVIETVLTNRLDGEFSGPVNCMVTNSLYSRDGQHVLVPVGSRVLGDVRPVNSFGQQRLAVVFHRLIMPDGYSLSLDQFQGLNQIGETGLTDKVNHHYLQVFGVSLAIGAIAGLGHANSGTGSDLSALDAYEQGVTSSLTQSSLRILDRYLNVLPTFTIREGHRVKIYLSDDLILPAYDRHVPIGTSTGAGF